MMSYYTSHKLERFIRPELAEQLVVHRFAPGDVICELGQPLDHLSFFVEGCAKVFVPGSNTRQLLLCFYQPLQLLGDLELFEQTPHAVTTVVALHECICLSLPRSVVLEQLASDPLFLQQLNASMSQRLSSVIRKSALNMLQPLEKRVASYMLATATPNERQQLVFSGNLTHTADALGTSFRHLHRTLQALCKQGVMEKHATSYVILQREELERRAADICLFA